MSIKSIYDSILSFSENEEIFETLLKNRNIKIERIISSGQFTEKGVWYDQDINEWILLVQGEAILEFENKETVKMKKGNYYNIPSHLKHRVAYTSKKPKCIWLAVLYK